MQDFYSSGERFGWWAIEGPGGIGKSRLALESLLTLPSGWYAGFLAHADLRGFDFRTWMPDESVVMVIDDAAAVPTDRLQTLIDTLSRTAGAWRHRVRVLLLERAINGQPWWDEVCGRGQDSYADRIRLLHIRKPLVLGRLDGHQRRAVLEKFLAATPQGALAALPAGDHPAWAGIWKLTDNGRPLFIGMVAAAIAEKGLEGLRQWTISHLLEFVHDRELQAWKRICPDTALLDRSRRLAAIATACGGLDFGNDERRLLERLTSTGLPLADDPRLWQTVVTATGARNGVLEPDVLGEYFLLQLWRKPFAGPIKAVADDLLCAWDLAPHRCLEAIARSATDFPEPEEPMWWLEVLARERFAKDQHSILKLHVNMTQSYAEAGHIDHLSAILERLSGWSRAGVNHIERSLARAAGFAVHAYGAAQRWPELRRWLAESRNLAKHFPANPSLQVNLVWSARMAIRSCGEAQQWEHFDFAFACLRDVEMRHPHLNSDGLASAAALGVFHSATAGRVENLDEILAMLVRLHRLKVQAPSEQMNWHLAGNAFSAAIQFGRRGYLGHLLWAYFLFHDTAAQSRGRKDKDIESLKKELEDFVRQGNELVQEQFAAAREARKTVDEIAQSAARKDASAATHLADVLKRLAGRHDRNWLLRVHLAQGLAGALSAFDTAQPGQVEDLLADLRQAVATVPACCGAREWLAAGLGHALASICRTGNGETVRLSPKSFAKPWNRSARNTLLIRMSGRCFPADYARWRLRAR